MQLLDLDFERLRFQRALHQHFEPLDVDGLRQEIHGAPLHRLDGGIDVAVGGHHEHGRALWKGEGLVDDLEPRLPGHAQIGQDDVEGLGIEEIERFVGARGDCDIVVVGQRLLQTLAGVFLVIDDEHAGDHGNDSHGAVRAGQARAGEGRGAGYFDRAAGSAP